MNAISPFTLLERATRGSIAGAVVDFAITQGTKAAQGHGPLAEVASDFTDVLGKLDANHDGKLNSKDVLGHAVNMGARTLDRLGHTMGLDESAPTSTSAMAGDEADTSRASAHASGGPVQMILAGQIPGFAAVAANAPQSETLVQPAVDAIRATYAAMRAAR